MIRSGLASRKIISPHCKECVGQESWRSGEPFGQGGSDQLDKAHITGEDRSAWTHIVIGRKSQHDLVTTGGMTVF